MEANDLFRGRKLVIATMHGKEKVIGPQVVSRLGVLPVVTTKINTDLFGTFSGEIERADSPIVTARKKCLLAMKFTGCDLAVASEGSFGSHPNFVFLPANEELVILLDRKNDLEIVGTSVSLNTNFNARKCNTLEELLNFTASTGFPYHALILRGGKETSHTIFKGIRSYKDLARKFEILISKYNEVLAETDMRAMFNPTRMQVISLATKAMLDKATTYCVKCCTPGFGITGLIEGLPCSKCGSPTRSPKLYIYKCNKCNYQEEKPVSDNFEDPGFCDRCNP